MTLYLSLDPAVHHWCTCMFLCLWTFVFVHTSGIVFPCKRTYNFQRSKPKTEKNKKCLNWKNNKISGFVIKFNHISLSNCASWSANELEYRTIFVLHKTGLTGSVSGEWLKNVEKSAFKRGKRWIVISDLSSVMLCRACQNAARFVKIQQH